MSTVGGSWRVAGRLARREVRRHPWRHLLVVGLILVPVLAALGAFSALATFQQTDQRKAAFEGPGPDLIRYETDQNSRSLADNDLGSPAVQARLGLPKGTPAEVAWAGSDWLYGDRQRTDDRGPLLVGTELIEATEGSTRSSELVVDDGRLPRAADEIFLTVPTADEGGWDVGDTVTSARSGRAFEVTGVGLLGYDTERRAAAVAGLPASFWTQPLSGIDGVEVGRDYAEPILPRQILDARVDDIAVREALVGAPGFYQRWDGAGAVDRRVGAGLTMAAAAICAVVAVVASAALAISSRRQLRSIGLLLTIGADPGTIRRAMVLQGAIPGLIAGVAAVAIAGATVLVVNAADILERASNISGARASLSLIGAAIVVLLGLGAGTLAAWQPARTSSRVPTLSALAGRRPVGPVPTSVPVGGAVLWGCGAAVLLLAFGNHRSGVADQAEPFLIIGGIAAIAFGGVGLAPAVVALLGPIAARFRGTQRMALRGLARHRMQSAATVAAIGVVLAIPVGLLTTRNLVDLDAGGCEDCGLAEPPATSIPATSERQSILLGAYGGTRVQVHGALRSAAADQAIEDLHELLGPSSAVIRTLPIVDQTGAWRRVSIIDEDAARATLEPWAADAIEAGRAISFRPPVRNVAFTVAGETATFDVDDPAAGATAGWPVSADYLVGADAMHGVGAERPAESVVVLRADPLTATERSTIERLAGEGQHGDALQGVPTLAEVQAAVASGDDPARPEPAPGVHISLDSDGSAPRPYEWSSDTSTPRGEWNRWLLGMAAASGVLALLVLTITLSLRAVDGEPDRRAAFAAGVAPAGLRRQRAFEGVVLSLLGALLALPLGWIPVIAASLGSDEAGRVGSWLAGPGWLVVPVLLAPALAAAVLWTVLPALAAAVRTARHRTQPDDLLPRW